MCIQADKLSKKSEKSTSEKVARKVLSEETNDDNEYDSSCKQVPVKMPAFVITNLDSSDKLYGHKNFLN